MQNLIVLSQWLIVNLCLISIIIIYNEIFNHSMYILHKPLLRNKVLVDIL